LFGSLESPSWRVRCEAIDEMQVGVYNCVNRCVRRAFSCGQDPVSEPAHDRGWFMANSNVSRISLVTAGRLRLRF
jgi:hypothetical protein